MKTIVIALFALTYILMLSVPKYRHFTALTVAGIYVVMGVVNSKTAARVGEPKIAAWEPLFDFVEPWVRFIIRATQPKQIYKWR